MRTYRQFAVALTLIASASLSLLTGQALAASKTWDGGCGVETSWSCAGNWSDNAVPGPVDRVIFDSTSTNNSTVDPSFAGEVGRVDIEAGYTGTVSLARSLTVSGLFSQSAGAFTATNQGLSLANFTLSGGSFTASSGTTSVSRDLTFFGSPTFHANGGTVSFSGKKATLECDGKTFNLVTFTFANGLKTVGSSCTLPLGKNPTIGGESAALELAGTLSGSGTLTMPESAGRLTVDSSGTLSGFTGLAVKSLEVNGATANFGSYESFSVGKAFIQTGGTVTVPKNAQFVGSFTVNAGSTFNAPTGTVSFAYRFEFDPAATFNANGGTVNFNGTQGGAIFCGNQTFNKVKFTHTENNRLVGSDCTLPLGSNPVIGGGPSGGIALSGTLTGKNTLFTATGASLILNEGYAITGFSGLKLYGLSVNSGAADISGYSPVTLAGSLLVKTGAALVAPARLNVAANVTVEPEGAFEANGGLVVLNGSNQAIAGDIAFENLTKRATAVDTLKLGAGDTQTVEGALILEGASAGSRLSLVSSSPGTPWLIDPAGTAFVRYASVADSTNIGPTIVCHSCVNAGGNTGWTF